MLFSNGIRKWSNFTTRSRRRRTRSRRRRTIRSITSQKDQPITKSTLQLLHLPPITYEKNDAFDTDLLVGFDADVVVGEDTDFDDDDGGRVNDEIVFVIVLELFLMLFKIGVDVYVNDYVVGNSGISAIA
jgi:hypothetical protein